MARTILIVDDDGSFATLSASTCCSRPPDARRHSGRHQPAPVKQIFDIVDRTHRDSKTEDESWRSVKALRIINSYVRTGFDCAVSDSAAEGAQSSAVLATSRRSFAPAPLLRKRTFPYSLIPNPNPSLLLRFRQRVRIILRRNPAADCETRYCLPFACRSLIAGLAGPDHDIPPLAPVALSSAISQTLPAARRESTLARLTSVFREGSTSVPGTRNRDPLQHRMIVHDMDVSPCGTPDHLPVFRARGDRPMWFTNGSPGT